MKLAPMLSALGLLSACAAAGTTGGTHPGRPVSPSAARPGSLLTDQSSGLACALTVNRGSDIMIVQAKPGAPATVQRPDGQHILTLKESSGDTFAGYASDQMFEDETISIRLILKPSAKPGRTIGLMTIGTPKGLTAILPISASVACRH